MFIFAQIPTPTPSPQKSYILLPTQYDEFQDDFDKDKATSLLKHWTQDCHIDLQPTKYQSWRPIDKLLPVELKVLRDYIETIASEFIRHSKSPTSALMFFIRKKDGSLHLVVDD